MKVASCLLVLVAVAAAVPQPRQDFHEHFEDFVTLILQEGGEQLGQLTETYQQFEEFNSALDYMKTNDFKEIVLEMESLPEFQAVVDFLEADNIDITYFLEKFDEVLSSIPSSRSTRQASGSTLSSFIQDSIAIFPQQKLDELFQQKRDDDEGFRNAIDNLFSDEWDAVFTTLWETPQFQKEVEALSSNGIDIYALIGEVVAVFGQKTKLKSTYLPFEYSTGRYYI